MVSARAKCYGSVFSVLYKLYNGTLTVEMILKIDNLQVLLAAAVCTKVGKGIFICLFLVICLADCVHYAFGTRNIFVSSFKGDHYFHRESGRKKGRHRKSSSFHL